MAHEIFFRKIRTYAPLSETAQNAWDKLLRRKRYSKGDDFVTEGQIPTSFAFVVEGLFYQRYTGREGDRVVKYFFPEHRIAASVSATLAGQPSVFTITAIEDSVVLEYSFAEFRKLVSIFPDIAAFYIRYMEQHWIIEKEPDEISFRHDTALERYQRLVRKSPTLVKRLKQHHIAAWLGITPESLSRLKKGHR